MDSNEILELGNQEVEEHLIINQGHWLVQWDRNRVSGVLPNGYNPALWEKKDLDLQCLLMSVKEILPRRLILSYRVMSSGSQNF